VIKIAETQPPTPRALRSAQIFTASVAVLTLTALAVNAVATPDQFALSLTGLGLLIGAYAVFGAGLITLYLRGDYILRMFGIMWPIMLVRADEFQRTERQRAFSFSYLVVLNLILVLCGAAAIATVIWPSGLTLDALLDRVDHLDVLALAATLLMLAAILPQGYLAWTLKPAEQDEDAA